MAERMSKRPRKSLFELDFIGENSSEESFHSDSGSEYVASDREGSGSDKSATSRSSDDDDSEQPSKKRARMSDSVKGKGKGVKQPGGGKALAVKKKTKQDRSRSSTGPDGKRKNKRKGGRPAELEDVEDRCFRDQGNEDFGDEEDVGTSAGDEWRQENLHEQPTWPEFTANAGLQFDSEGFECQDFMNKFLSPDFWNMLVTSICLQMKMLLGSRINTSSIRSLQTTPALARSRRGVGSAPRKASVVTLGIIVQPVRASPAFALANVLRHTTLSQ